MARPYDTDTETINRIKKRVSINKNGCWVWNGCKNAAGYGRIGYRGKTVYTHRLVIKLIKSENTIDLCVDHICRNKSCCNPEHLRVVTAKVNALENSESGSAKNFKKTHCKFGHEFNLINTNFYTYPSGKTSRKCRICDRIQSKARRNK